jgi:hypothetical protein
MHDQETPRMRGFFFVEKITQLAHFVRHRTDQAATKGVVCTLQRAPGPHRTGLDEFRSESQMINHSHSTMKLAMATTIAFAALLVASCSLPGSPKQVDSANPSVTYKYSNDDQLIEANQRAITYCNQFESFPRSQSFTKAADGSNIVIFECVNSTLATASTNQPNSGLIYNYRTDQELLDASRNAQVYCVNHGSPEMDSTIVANSNGSKTVTFRCNAS